MRTASWIFLFSLLGSVMAQGDVRVSESGDEFVAGWGDGSCKSNWAKCGQKNFATNQGEYTCCSDPAYTCKKDNDWWYACRPKTNDGCGHCLDIESLPLLATGPSTDDIDSDGDGFTPNDGDCDDEDATVYPGAPELCDGILNNCDNDEIPPSEVDNDGDGISECEGDCNDSDPSMFLGATEVCSDQKDNDCDGSVDEGCAVDTQDFGNSDINECAFSPCNSNAYCQNTFGSFQCWCPRGYRLQGSDCTAETENAIEMSLLLRDVQEASLSAELEMFTWLFASTLTSTNPAQVAYSAMVDTTNTPFGIIVSINALLSTEEAGNEAVQRFFASEPSFTDKVAAELGMRATHYGRALTPARRKFVAPGASPVSIPSMFQIDSVDMSVYKVLYTADVTLHVLEVIFEPDDAYVLPEDVDFLSAIRVGTGSDIAAAQLQEACRAFRADVDAQQVYFEGLDKRACAPNISAASVCDLDFNATGPITFYVPVTDSMLVAGASTLFLQFEVSMASPETGIVYTLPVGQSISLAAFSANTYCNEVALPSPLLPPTTTEAEDTSTPPPQKMQIMIPQPDTTAEDDGDVVFQVGVASYNADAEILQPDTNGEEAEDMPELPTMAIGSAAGVVFVVVVSGAGAVIVRRRKTRRGERDSQANANVWIDNLQTQITSDFMLATTHDSKDKGYKDHSPSDMLSVDHLAQGITRRDMSNRIAGHHDDAAMVSAIVCIDDGKRNARVVAAEALAAACASDGNRGSNVTALEKKRRNSSSLE